MDDILLLQSSLDLLKSQASCVFWTHIRNAKNMAQEFDDPADLISEYAWNFSPKEIDPDDMRRLNIMFDLQGSFARAALAVLLVETYFPGTEIKVIEVLKKKSIRDTLKKLNDKDITDSETRINLAKRLIALEEYRIVLIVNGKQFDPLSCCVSGVTYPEDNSYNPWAALKVCQIVDMALRTEDLEERLRCLWSAQSYCPNMMMVEENIAISSAFLEQRIDQVCRKLKNVRLTAKLLHKMWIEYGATDIQSKYPREVFTLLDERHSRSLKREIDSIGAVADGLPQIH